MCMAPKTSLNALTEIWEHNETFNGHEKKRLTINELFEVSDAHRW